MGQQKRLGVLLHYPWIIAWQPEPLLTWLPPSLVHLRLSFPLSLCLLGLGLSLGLSQCPHELNGEAGRGVASNSPPVETQRCSLSGRLSPPSMSLLWRIIQNSLHTEKEGSSVVEGGGRGSPRQPPLPAFLGLSGAGKALMAQIIAPPSYRGL